MIENKIDSSHWELKILERNSLISLHIDSNVHAQRKLRFNGRSAIKCSERSKRERNGYIVWSLARFPPKAIFHSWIMHFDIERKFVLIPLYSRCFFLLFFSPSASSVYSWFLCFFIQYSQNVFIRTLTELKHIHPKIIIIKCKRVKWMANEWI